jgi:enamine deaminase RidA (YjgF/YER057c/UK114 family)
VKVLGMVNATPDFKDHPKVIDGCSDLLLAVFADRGRHARAAVGMSSLAADASVEIEMVVEIDAAQ